MHFTTEQDSLLQDFQNEEQDWEFYCTYHNLQIYKHSPLEQLKM